MTLEVQNQPAGEPYAALIGVDYDEHKPGSYRGLIVFRREQRSIVSTGDMRGDMESVLTEFTGKRIGYLSSIDHFATDDPQGYSVLMTQPA